MSHEDIRFGFLEPETNIFYEFDSQKEYLAFLHYISQSQLTDESLSEEKCSVLPERKDEMIDYEYSTQMVC